MLKFCLTVAEKYEGGFKLSVQADTEKSQELAGELTKLLIAKIEKISVEIKGGQDYE